jgi:hypothetical protein
MSEGAVESVPAIRDGDRVGGDHGEGSEADDTCSNRVAGHHPPAEAGVVFAL